MNISIHAVVFSLYSTQPDTVVIAAAVNVKYSPLPLHQMILCRKHLHRLLRNTEDEAFMNRLNYCCDTLTTNDIKAKIDFLLLLFFHDIVVHGNFKVSCI